MLASSPAFNSMIGYVSTLRPDVSRQGSALQNFNMSNQRIEAMLRSMSGFVEPEDFDGHAG